MNSFGNKDDPNPVNHSELLYNRPIGKFVDVVGNMQTRYQMTFDKSLNDREFVGTAFS